MNGYIVKGIGGFYYVKTPDGIVECKPRGIFRKQKITIAVYRHFHGVACAVKNKKFLFAAS